MPLHRGVLFALEVGAVFTPMLGDLRACGAGSSRSHLPGIVGGPAWSLGAVMTWTAASFVGIALAGAIGLAAPLTAVVGGWVVWKRFSGANRGGKVLLTRMFGAYVAGLGLLAASCAYSQAIAPVKSEIAGRWSQKQAWNWYKRNSPIVGVNYVPSTAVNMMEWWQADSFDPNTMEREMAFAKQSGFNSVRANLPELVWENDPAGLKKRVDQFLDMAARHGQRVMLCLFDDVNFARAEPVLGRQPPPVPGVHNSRWTPSPSPKMVRDRKTWPTLQRYVEDMVGTFRNDRRILVWDLYNEPGNSGLGLESIALVEKAFAWARSQKPVQPVTTGVFNPGLGERPCELSDIVTFHNYRNAASMEGIILHLSKYGRPLILTEGIRREAGKAFAHVLPVLARHCVGWYSWGLVAGKQQTYLPWEIQGKTIQDPWHWDLLWPDGRPYDPKEIEWIHSFRFADTCAHRKLQTVEH